MRRSTDVETHQYDLPIRKKAPQDRTKSRNIFHSVDFSVLPKEDFPVFTEKLIEEENNDYIAN